MPKRRSDRGFTLIELMIVVAVVAILAVVAVPQYTKYMRAAKQAEVVQMLDLVKKGATSYYTTPRIFQGTGDKVPCQFPSSVGITPTGASCCDAQNDADDDERCDSRPAAWDSATWSALRFRITDQHYYQYGFASKGSLAGAIFTASAYGDLDCDGIHSTFQVVVDGDPKATYSECDAVLTAGMFRDNETE